MGLSSFEFISVLQTTGRRMQGFYFWAGFHVLIALLLAFDLGVFIKRKSPSVKVAWIHTGFWVVIAFLFNYFVYLFLGTESALQFFTGYLIEKSLSVDNLFIFLMIFLHFRISEELQHKVLFWGILGAIAMRLCLILVGIALISRFHWMFYLLGAFLIFTGIKFALQKQRQKDPLQSWTFRFFKKILPFEEKKGKGKFFVKTNGKWKVTSLFLVLLFIETTDVFFALDSIPAVFAVTTDPMIVYTSNVFAILGLRSLYFVLESSLSKLKYYQLGLAAILVFVGCKMVLSEVYPISLPVSLAVIVGILAATVLFSSKRVQRS